MVDHVLDLAATWTAWDGRPTHVDDRVYTPHKAIRRVADHLLDHLAELESRLVGEKPLPDHWHASASTTQADLAPSPTRTWTRRAAGSPASPVSGRTGSTR